MLKSKLMKGPNKPSKPRFKYFNKIFKSESTTHLHLEEQFESDEALFITHKLYFYLKGNIEIICHNATKTYF